MHFTNFSQLKKPTLSSSRSNKTEFPASTHQSYVYTWKWNPVEVSLTPFPNAQLSAVTLISDRHANTLPWHCYNFLMSPITELLGPTEGSSPHVISTKYLSLLSVWTLINAIIINAHGGKTVTNWPSPKISQQVLTPSRPQRRHFGNLLRPLSFKKFTFVTKSSSFSALTAHSSSDAVLSAERNRVRKVFRFYNIILSACMQYVCKSVCVHNNRERNRCVTGTCMPSGFSYR